jgi:hypothetical protein
MEGKLCWQLADFYKKIRIVEIYKEFWDEECPECANYVLKLTSNSDKESNNKKRLTHLQLTIILNNLQEQ